jgi:hypothetical protein
MIHVEPFRAWHLAAIKVQPGQAREWPDCTERDARAKAFALAEHGNSVGQLIFATRWCRAYLAALTVRRIDMYASGGFAEAQRWAAMLGFGHEGIKHGFYPDGSDLHMWAMIDGRPFRVDGGPV